MTGNTVAVSKEITEKRSVLELAWPFIEAELLRLEQLHTRQAVNLLKRGDFTWEEIQQITADFRAVAGLRSILRTFMAGLG